MSDVVISAMITVGGMLGVAIVTALVQLRVTRAAIDSEHAKIVRQIRGESEARALEHRRSILHDTLADLVSATDPEVNARIDYAATVKLIHKAQLLLNRDEATEKDLNGALNRLGIAVRAHAAAIQRDGGLDDEEEMKYRRQILNAHGRMIDSSQALLVGYSGESFLGHGD